MKRTHNIYLAMAVVAIIYVIYSLFFTFSGKIPKTKCELDFFSCNEILYRPTFKDDHPKHKLVAYVITNPMYPKNLEFIQQEWNHYIDIRETIFEKSSNGNGATDSHLKALTNIWERRNDKSLFPVVILEDDVYRFGHFGKYWNALHQLERQGVCDYVTFDPMYVQLSAMNDVIKIHPDFRILTKHNGAGFIVYFQEFFQRFNTRIEFESMIDSIIDISFTHSIKMVKCTPKRHVVRQIVNKISMTSSSNTPLTFYSKEYDSVDNQLQKI